MNLVYWIQDWFTTLLKPVCYTVVSLNSLMADLFIRPLVIHLSLHSSMTLFYLSGHFLFSCRWLYSIYETTSYSVVNHHSSVAFFYLLDYLLFSCHSSLIGGFKRSRSLPGSVRCSISVWNLSLWALRLLQAVFTLFQACKTRPEIRG